MAPNMGETSQNKNAYGTGKDTKKVQTQTKTLLKLVTVLSKC